MWFLLLQDYCYSVFCLSFPSFKGSLFFMFHLDYPFSFFCLFSEQFTTIFHAITQVALQWFCQNHILVTSFKSMIFLFFNTYVVQSVCTEYCHTLLLFIERHEVLCDGDDISTLMFCSIFYLDKNLFPFGGNYICIPTFLCLILLGYEPFSF